MHLKEVGLQPKSGLSGSGTADDQDVLVPRCSRILWTVAHGQTLRCRQDHVVLELGIHEGLDISMGAPVSYTHLDVYKRQLPDRKTICIMERGNEKCQPKNESTQRRRVTMRPSRRGQCG